MKVGLLDFISYNSSSYITRLQPQLQCKLLRAGVWCQSIKSGMLHDTEGETGSRMEVGGETR